MAGNADLNTDFDRLQKDLVSPLDGTGRPRVVVVLPSFTLDQAGMTKIPGIMYYEERLLSFLHLLRHPDRHLVYVTSMPMPDHVVDYALGLVRSLPAEDARRRLTLVDCADPGPEPLTRKILRRPEVIERLQRSLTGPEDACLLAFNGDVDPAPPGRPGPAPRRGHRRPARPAAGAEHGAGHARGGHVRFGGSHGEVGPAARVVRCSAAGPPVSHVPPTA